MIGLLIYVGIYVALWAYQRWLAPKAADSQAKRAQAGQFNVPRNQESVPIPIFWGRVRVRGPVVIYARNFLAQERREEVGGDNIVVGYTYRMMVQFLIGTPGNRESTAAPSTLKQVFVGDRQVWSGSLSDPNDNRYVQRPSLLGGPNAGGGVEGLINYLPGSFTQTNNAWLKHAIRIGGLSAQVANQDVAYRGQAVVTLYGVGTTEQPYDPEDFGGTGNDGDIELGSVLEGAANHLKPRGWKFGEAPQLDGYSFEVMAISSTNSLGAVLSGVGVEANPINILYDLLINPWNRAGIPAALIDGPSFLAAGQTLLAEGHGMSLLLSSAMDARQGVQLILDQTNGVLFQDPSSGKLVFKLIRDDYTVALLPLISPTSTGIKVRSFASGNWHSTYNQVRVTFTNRLNNYADGVALAQDLANFNASGAKFRSSEISYPGCTTQELANKLAARDLRGLSVPLMKLTLECDRTAFYLRPGDAFRFTWPEFNNMTDVVFRVVKFGLGKPGAETITIECFQDIFSLSKTAVYRIPFPNRYPRIPPFPSRQRIAEEAPIWIAKKAEDAGRVVDHSAPRAYHLAIPRGTSTTYHAEVSVDGGSVARDIEPQPFPFHATVETAYARALDPYDTGTGLRITGLAGYSPIATTDDDVAFQGKNLIRIDEEILGFTAVTLISGTAGEAAAVWRLQNVWRGLLDTVPTDHDVGAVVYFLSSTTGIVVSRVGRVGWKLGDTVVTRQVYHADNVRHEVPLRDFVPTASEFADPSVATIPLAADDNVLNDGTVFEAVVARCGLVYPPADMLVDSAKVPAQLAEGGVDVSWKRRNRLRDDILRGDQADEEPEPGTKYQVIARKGGDGADVDITVELDGATITAGDLALGDAGYGDVQVGVRAIAPLLDVSAAFAAEATIDAPAWQVPRISVDAPHWRNQLINGRFDDALTGWDIETGDATAANGAQRLGAAGHYVTTAIPPTTHTTISQTRGIAGYSPRGLLAEAQFDHHNLTGGSSEIELVLEALDSSSGSLGTASSGVLTPSATEWHHASIRYVLPAGTAKVVTRLKFGTSDQGATGVTEVVLRIGQMASIGGSFQLLTNPDFESALGTGWTNHTNSFVTDTTAPIYMGARYARPGDFASSEIRQDIAVPDGYEVGAAAVLELGRANYGSDLDTGEVILEAYDAGTALLASVTTGAETISPASVWQRRRLVLQVPDTTATLRTRLLGVRATGTTCDTAFDDLDLRMYKELDTVTEHRFTFDVPASQPLPASLDYWDRAWPAITVPSMAMWCGDEGAMGIEPELAVDEDATGIVPPTKKAKFVGAYDATADGAVVTTCYEFPTGCDTPLIVGDDGFAALTSDTSLTVWIALKLGEETLGTAMAIAGRFGATGWHLTINASGNAKATLVGDAGTKTAIGTRFLCDRAVHLIALVYDATAQELRLIDEDGEIITSTASGLGEVAIDAINMQVGDVPGSSTATLGDAQLARLYVWSSAIATADLQTMMSYGALPDPALIYTRAGVLATVVGSDAGGVLVTRFDEKQAAVGYSAALTTDEGTGRGLVLQGEYPNNFDTLSQAQATGDWVTVGSTVTIDYGVGVEGLKNSVQIVGDNTTWREVRGLTAGTRTSKLVAFFARETGTTFFTSQLEILNASGVSKGTWNYTAHTDWRLFWHVFTGWDDSTPTCNLRWYGSTSGTPGNIEICGPFLLNEEANMLPAIPVGSGSIGISDMRLNVTMPEAFNAEGEILVRGVAAEANPDVPQVLVDITNGANAHDQRTLYVDGSDSLSFDHYDGAGTVNTSTVASSTWDALWSARGRWCRAFLTDGSNKTAGAIFGDAVTDPSNYGRTAAWTPSTQQLNQINLGISGLGAPLPCLIREVILRAREDRL
jgi:hypothetical protein